MLFLAWLAIELVLFVATALLTPKPNIPDATPEDPQGPRSQEGEVLPVVFGTVKISANVSYFGGVLATEETEHVKTGIFSSKNVTTGYRYSAVFQAILCHGPLDEVLDVVFDDNKSLAAMDYGPAVFGDIDTDGDGITDSYGVISGGGVMNGKTAPFLPRLRSDVPIPDNGQAFGMNYAEGIFGGYQKGGGLRGGFTIYYGTPNQVVSPVMQWALNSSQYKQKYEGVAHAVFGRMTGTFTAERFEYGERSVVPALEFIVRRCPSNLGLTAAQTNINGGANPAEAIYDVLTNPVWGLAMPPGHIDFASFVAVGITLAAEGFGINMSLNQSQQANDVVAEFLRYIDGQLQQNPVTGLVELTINRNDYDVATLPLLNESNVESCNITRPTWSSSRNEVRVLWTRRVGVFFKQITTQPIQDIAAQRNFADVNAVTVEYAGVMDAVLANRLAVRDLRRTATPLGKARLTVDRTAADFRVGRVFLLGWGDYGVSARVHRVVSVDYGTLTDGKIVVDAVEDIFALEQPMYNVPIDALPLEQRLGSTQLLNITPTMTETPTKGTLILGIDSPAELITSVEFQSQSGNRAPSAWHQSETTGAFLATVDKHSYLQSSIQWRVNGHLKDGTLGILASGAVSFDVEAMPEMPDVTFIPGTVAGRLSALVELDGDTTTIKYAVSKVGLPSVATVRATAPVAIPLNQTEVTILDVITLNAGEEAFITVLGYDAAGNESDPGRLAENATVIYPVLRASPAENGLVGTLTLRPVDPQNRLTRVSVASVLGNNVAVFADLAPVGGVYTVNVTLVEKQPSRIDYRGWAMVGGVEQIVDEDSVRFAVGSIPIPPEVSYQIDPDGTLTVISKGDSDTTLQHIVVALDAAPTSDTIDASVSADNAFSGRNAAFVYKVGGLTRKLLIGQKFYIGVRAYNTNLPGALNAQGSQLVVQTDQWIGPSDARATVLVGAAVADSRSVTLSGIVLGPQTSRVVARVREYRTDPGTVGSVFSIGHEAPGSPLLANGSLILPVANPGNWIIVTLQATDSLNRLGVGVLAGAGQAAGTVTIKVQSTAAAQPAPNPPSNLVLSVVDAATANLAITMPGSGVPASLRIYRDGVALPDIAVSVLAGAVQNVVDGGRTPGASYTYQVYGVSAAGILSATGSPVRTIAMPAMPQIPTPVLAAGDYNSAQGGIPITITPAAGTPDGVTFQLEHSTQQIDGTTGNPLGYGPWSNAESSTALSFIHAHGLTQRSQTDKLRVSASKVGYTTSLTSAEVVVNMPRYQFTFGGG